MDGFSDRFVLPLAGSLSRVVTGQSHEIDVIYYVAASGLIALVLFLLAFLFQRLKIRPKKILRWESSALTGVIKPTFHNDGAAQLTGDTGDYVTRQDFQMLLGKIEELKQVKSPALPAPKPPLNIALNLMTFVFSVMGGLSSTLAVLYYFRLIPGQIPS